jgi:hypothetical protein
MRKEYSEVEITKKFLEIFLVDLDKDAGVLELWKD